MISRVRGAGLRGQVALERGRALAAPAAEGSKGRLPELVEENGDDEAKGASEPRLVCATRRGRHAVNRVNVAVAEDARDCIDEVAAACRAVGLDHTATLTSVGVLTGSVEFATLAKLWAIPGVLAVEVERGFQS